MLTLLAMMTMQAVTPEYGYKVVRAYPHDRGAFTQGLEYRGGYLYESTGLEGRSSVRRVKLETGEVLGLTSIPAPLFGEGITVLNKLIVQLTWRHGTGFVYEQDSFKRLRQFQYTGEGWGLTNDGRQIYMSDGTADIRVWDGSSLKELRRLRVRDGTAPVMNLNELEFVRGEVWANVWQTERVARISPNDGRVLGWIDLAGLLPPSEQVGVDVMNGIAYDSMGDRLFVTGKLWPKIFEIKLVPKNTRR